MPSLRRVSRLRIVAGLSHICRFIAGATSRGQLRAKTSVVSRSSAKPLATLARKSAEAGAISAGYVMLRLPHEVKQLFRTWLQTHYPLKASHVMNRVRDIRGGRDNDPEFASRMRGTGIYAAIIEQRFRAICERLGLNRTEVLLETSLFRRTAKQKNQIELF